MDPLYLIMILPALLLAIIATLITKSTFAKYAKVAASSRLTGAQAAERLLARSNLRDVRIERIGGFLGDHYDPRTRTLRLSPDVFDSDSLSAIGVACHEAGHAIQHATHYAPLSLRSALVPVTQFGSIAPYIIIPLGVLFHSFP